MRQPGTCAPAAHEHSDAYTQAKAALDVIGLAILVVFFRNRGSIAVEDVSMMRG